MSRFHLHRAVLLLALAHPLRAAVINVGPGGAGAGCEAGDVESAVTLAAATLAADEIRVVNTQIFNLSAGIHLTDWNATSHGALTISGGWDSCTDTTAGITRSRIQYTGAAPVIEIDTTAGGSSQVTLKTIRLEGSNGRGLLVQGSSTVDLLRFEATANDGGGISIQSGASVYIEMPSYIHDNGPTAEGGGLRCTGAGSDVTLGAEIRYNDAEFGGAIYAGASCEVILDSSFFYDNHAAGARAGDGGAIYAEGGALVSTFAPITFSSNSAAGYGGAIAARGDGTLVLLTSAFIEGSEAGVGGGALYATQGAHIGVGGGRCTRGFCASSIAANNLATGSGDGVVALATEGGVIDLHQSYSDFNVIDEDEPHGSVFHADGIGSAIRTESIQVFHNTGADRVFEVTSGALIRAAFTTVGSNTYFDGSTLTEALAFYASGTGSRARSYTSIYYPSAGFYLGPGTDPEFDCLIVQTRSGLPFAASEVFVGNPSYVDPGLNLRVGDGSPAVDFCDTFFFSPTVGDLDGRPRGHDHPANVNGNPGPFGSASVQDTGAYELWELLRDGFETGNASRWTAAHP